MMDLCSQIKDLLEGTIVILGIGNTLKSDDGIGVLIARSLTGKVGAEVIDCGEAPENYTGVIRREKPDMVLIIDAVDFGGKIGEMSLIKQEDISNLGLTTHNMSLKLLIDFIKSELKSGVVILGIQPHSTAFGEHLSKEVLSSIPNIEKMLIDVLGEQKCTI